MTKPQRKIIKKLTISEISGCVTPAQSGAVVTIMKSADGDRNRKVNRLVDIQLSELSIVEAGANQHSKIVMRKTADEDHIPNFPEKPTAEGEATIQKLLAAVRGEPLSKSQEPTMTQHSEYDRLIQATIAKSGGTPVEAHLLLAKSDPDGLARAYNADAAAKVTPIGKATYSDQIKPAASCGNTTDDLVKSRMSEFGESHSVAFNAVKNTAEFAKRYAGEQLAKAHTDAARGARAI